MGVKAVLFDLDGTLLPMDQEVFVKTYCKLLAVRLATRGYEPKQFVDCLWQGVGAMVKNDGSMTNEEAFWKVFTDIYGEEAMKDKPFVDEFYRTEFNQVQSSCGFTPSARKIIDEVKAGGKMVVLATNPLFPAAATENRMRWAGLTPEDFHYYTTYDNSSYCKPNLKYYQEILSKIGCEARECIMIGNDVGEDMIAEELGMQVFLLTGCLINTKEVDIERYPHGGFEELSEFLKKALSI